jgi:hypothetical protein
MAIVFLVIVGWLVGTILMVAYMILAPIVTAIAVALYQLILRLIGRDPR